MNASKKLTKAEIKRYAAEVVSTMLMGRCSPEREDVRHLSNDHSENDCDAVIQEIERILSRLHKSLKA